MASVDVEIATRRYTIACRDGEEAHLREVAAIVDRRARDAAQALGNLGEARQLLFASLLLADDLKEAGGGAPAAAAPAADPGLGEALERLAERMESLADRLEQGAPAP
ncbi:MAG: cell division protein ZapA [Allosphingosinicella sp.]|uniref:cell division protein ZapA n=1 Tax=Allosphingosinicella sp. TaxID=2823234 RepID=UPI003931F85F